MGGSGNGNVVAVAIIPGSPASTSALSEPTVALSSMSVKLSAGPTTTDEQEVGAATAAEPISLATSCVPLTSLAGRAGQAVDLTGKAVGGRRGHLAAGPSALSRRAPSCSAIVTMGGNGESGQPQPTLLVTQRDDGTGPAETKLLSRVDSIKSAASVSSLAVVSPEVSSCQKGRSNCEPQGVAASSVEQQQQQVQAKPIRAILRNRLVPSSGNGSGGGGGGELQRQQQSAAFCYASNASASGGGFRQQPTRSVGYELGSGKRNSDGK